jgi:hypothetical protein
MVVSRATSRGPSLPEFGAQSLLQRTSSPANPLAAGASPSGAVGKSPVNTGADAKGKGKKRKSEAADKQSKAAGGAGGEEGWVSVQRPCARFQAFVRPCMCVHVALPLIQRGSLRGMPAKKKKKPAQKKPAEKKNVSATRLHTV